MNKDPFERIRERIINSFIDILALKELERESAVSGYDLITLIHRRFDVTVSSGTVYSALYSLERVGLVKGTLDSRKRIYTLTDKGKEALQTIRKAKVEIQRLTSTIF
jgi:DNA-binding PadR family transcriptional regulator